MSGTSAQVALAKWGRKCGERRLFRIADHNGNCRLNSDGGGTVIVALLRLSLSFGHSFIPDFYYYAARALQITRSA